MRRGAAHTRVLRCNQRVCDKRRRTHHIPHVMFDLRHRLADVGKPLTLTQREKCVPLQRIQCQRRGGELG